MGKVEEVQWTNNLNTSLLKCGKSGQKSRILQIIAGKNNKREGRPFIILKNNNILVVKSNLKEADVMIEELL